MLFGNHIRIAACAAALLISFLLNARVKPGIEVLRESGFESLKGKRVALVTNPSGVDSELKSTVDILFEAPGVNLVALSRRSTASEVTSMPAEKSSPA